ncbi:MAG TPA: exodeoxyribonuclease VII large subunit [Saprospiraceae bacterium]|nr:exodeoxyribonuclease VII large subunit [Saprospiraceae bacterium]
MQTYSLFELNEYLKRVVALNFQDPIWIHAEINQISESRGNYYLELVEQDEKSGNVVAQSSAAIWYRSFLFIKNKVGDLLPSLLSAGTLVEIKVKVEFNERYGMKLIIEDINPEYTIGVLEMERKKILERLKKAGVLDKNKSIRMPSVIQKIAVISSDRAAGYQDFVSQLNQNPYNYRFDIQLFQAAMQGRNTESEVLSAIDKIENSRTKFNTVVIIRGGGSKLDLSAFDNYNIGHRIATSRYPIVTGIGHDIDQTVADVVSHTSLKTPTAVANFIIEQNLFFEAEITQLWQNVVWLSNEKIKQETLRLEQIDYLVRAIPMEILRRNEEKIKNIEYQLHSIKNYELKKHSLELQAIDSMIKALDPEMVLKRGFAMVKQHGSYVSKYADLESGTLEIVMQDGSLELEKS